MPRRKRRKSEAQPLRELRDHADLIRRRSAELIRETEKISEEMMALKERLANQEIACILACCRKSLLV